MDTHNKDKRNSLLYVLRIKRSNAVVYDDAEKTQKNIQFYR